MPSPREQAVQLDHSIAQEAESIAPRRPLPQWAVLVHTHTALQAADDTLRILHQHLTNAKAPPAVVEAVHETLIETYIALRRIPS